MNERNKLYAYLFIAIVTLALILRIYHLDLRPFHHDEAVHGWFACKILSTGDYHYQPWAHGPFQFYITALVFHLSGASELTGRILPAIAGTLLVASVFPLRRYIGEAGAVFLALFLALSPSFLYYSRFFRNDIYLALFSLLVLILVLRYIETPNLHSAALAGLTAGLATSAKENAYVILFIFVSFGILYLIRERGRIRGKELVRENLPAIVTAIVVGCIVYYLFYSFFLKHPYDPFTAIPHAIDHWSSYTGGPSGPFYFYIPLMALYELPVLIFGVCGIIYYWVREKNNTLMLFLTYYFAFLMIVQASLHEKAPWLTVHLILPLSIIAAGFVDKLVQMEGKWVKRAAITVLGITLIFMVANSLALNYIRFVDPAEPMIQAAQPDMHFKEMISRVNEVASGLDGYNTRIIVTDPKLETQLLWNLRDYRKVRWRVDINSTLDAPLIFVHDLDADLVEKRLEERGYMRMEGRILQWYWWKPGDVNLRFILFREMDRDPDGYGVVLFYKE